MILQHLTDLITTSAGHVLAYAPTDPPQAPYPNYQPADPMAPHSVSVGKFIAFFLVFILTPTLVVAGYKILTKGGINGEMKKSFQMAMGTAMGVGVIALAITGAITGIIIFATNQAL